MLIDIYNIDPNVTLAITRLAEEIAISPARTEVIYSEKKTLCFKRNDCKVIYFLEDGEVELCNTDNNIIITNIKHPAFFGIANIFTEREYHFIRTVSEVKLYCMKQSDFIKIIDEKLLWKDIALIFSWYLELYAFRDCINAKATSSYSIVKIYLELLWSKSQDELEEISIFDFILNRTTVSRSSLNKIIKELTYGGYIKVNRGKLVYLKPLPQGY